MNYRLILAIAALCLASVGSAQDPGMAGMAMGGMTSATLPKNFSPLTSAWARSALVI